MHGLANFIPEFLFFLSYLLLSKCTTAVYLVLLCPQ